MKKKKLIGILDCAIIMLVSLIVLLGCQKAEYFSLNKKADTIYLRLGESFAVSKYIETEGSGEILYSVENSTALSIKGEVVTGIAEGTGTVIVSAGDLTIGIKVVVRRGEKVNLTFGNVNAEYNGAPWSVAVTGNIPTGTEIDYYYAETGEPFEGETRVGEYSIKAVVRLPDGFIADNTELYAVLKIEKAHYDLTGISFPNRTVTYDGNEHAVFLNGALPDGITVTYSGNRATEAGTYRATAYFSGENENYEKINPISCTFTISQRIFPFVENGFTDDEKTYDGESFSKEITGLPQNCYAKYYLSNGNGYTESQSLPTFVNAGSYDVYARLFVNEQVAANYLFTTKDKFLTFEKQDDGKFVSEYFSVTLTIDKATLKTGYLVLKNKSGAVRENITYGEEVCVGEISNDKYYIVAEGEMPYGVKNEFKSKVNINYSHDLSLNVYGNLDSGTHFIYADYVLPESYAVNYNAPERLEYALVVLKKTYDTSSVTFTLENPVIAYDGTVYEPTPQGYDENVFDVIYVYKKDGVTAPAVKHAGEYVITARFTLKEDSANYNPIPDMSLTMTIEPKNVNVSVEFPDLTTVYDNTAKTIEIAPVEPLPNYVTVTYENNSHTNAGEYTATANFAYTEEGYLREDYILYVNGKKVTVLSATLKINKAKYDASKVSDITAKEDLTYRIGMTLAEVEFEGERKDNVKWKNENEEIGTFSSVDGDATKGKFTSKAVYSEEWGKTISNYEPYEFNVTVFMNKQTINFDGATVPNQFVAFGDEPEIAVVFADGNKNAEYNKAVKTSAVTDNATGLTTVTVTPVKMGNCIFVGSGVTSGQRVVFGSVKIYRYDSASFTYGKGTTSLINYKGSATNVTVLDGTTKIATKAFENTAVKSVYIPDSVETIPDETFYGATNLAELNISSVNRLAGGLKKAVGLTMRLDSLKITVRNDNTIDERTFENISYLSEVVYLTPIVSIGEHAFESCDSLTVFTFDSTIIKTIGVNAFGGCSALLNLELPSLVGETEGSAATLDYYFGTPTKPFSLQKVKLFSSNPYVLANDAFYSQSKAYPFLKTITLSDSITAIGKRAFYGISADMDLHNAAVTTLGEYAFYGFKGKQLILPEGLTAMGNYSLAETENLTSITIPSFVTDLGENVFEGCKANVSFDPVSPLTVLGNRVFYGYLGETVSLPLGLTQLGNETFRGAINITRITFGNELETIGEYCFSGCSSLVRVDLSQKLRVIGQYAFTNCGAIKTMYFAGGTPEARTGALNTGSSFIIYIENGYSITDFISYADACGAGTRATVAFRG